MLSTQLNTPIRLARQEWLQKFAFNLGRGVVLFLVVFSILNLAGDFIHPGFDA